jgi:hypothetical protein
VVQVDPIFNRNLSVRRTHTMTSVLTFRYYGDYTSLVVAFYLQIPVCHSQEKVVLVGLQVQLVEQFIEDCIGMVSHTKYNIQTRQNDNDENAKR